MSKVRVRIAAVMDDRGRWAAFGRSGEEDDMMQGMALDDLESGWMDNRSYWVTAWLERPDAPVVAGKVSKARKVSKVRP